MKTKVIKPFAVLADIAVVLYLVYQQFYWVWYYGASVEGALYLTSDKTKFFRPCLKNKSCIKGKKVIYLRI